MVSFSWHRPQDKNPKKKRCGRKGGGGIRGNVKPRKLLPTSDRCWHHQPNKFYWISKKGEKNRQNILTWNFFFFSLSLSLSSKLELPSYFLTHVQLRFLSPPHPCPPSIPPTPLPELTFPPVGLHPKKWTLGRWERWGRLNVVFFPPLSFCGCWLGDENYALKGRFDLFY